MKVLIISFFEETYTPYLVPYQRVLQEMGVMYDMACFYRDGFGEFEEIDTVYGHKYIYHHATTANRLTKLLPVLRFGIMMHSILHKNNYDKLIVLTSVPAFMLCGQLVGKYANRYIFDYRDLTYERFRIFKKRIQNVVDHSYISYFSSPGFFEIYPQTEKTKLSHNFDLVDLQPQLLPMPDPRGRPIVIGAVGYIRYYEVNCSMLRQLCDGKQYRMRYIGTRFSDCDLPSFCKQEGIGNATFEGKFENSQKREIYKDIDMINAVYPVYSHEVAPAIPNRLYDAALYRRPILVGKGTYASHLAEEYGLGLTVDPEKENIAASIQTYWEHWDPDTFAERCGEFLQMVRRREMERRKEIIEFLRE